MFNFLQIWGRRKREVAVLLEEIKKALKSGEEDVEQPLATLKVAELKKYRRAAANKAIIIGSELLKRFSSLPEDEANLKKRRLYARAILALAPEIILSEIDSFAMSLGGESKRYSSIRLNGERFEAQFKALKCLSCQRDLDHLFSYEEQLELYEKFVTLANTIVRLDLGEMKPEVERYLDHLLRVISIFIRLEENWKLFLDVSQFVAWSDTFELIRSTISITHRQRHFVLSSNEMDQIEARHPEASNRIDLEAWKIQSAFQKSR